MNHILKEIEDLITEPMEKIGIIVDSVKWNKVDKYNYLEITLDRESGLDIDDIVEATNKINPIIDEADLIEEEYILDISSKERG